MYSVVYDWKRTVRSCVARGTQLKTKLYVVKQLHDDPDARDDLNCLFEKEVRLLDRVKDHPCSQHLRLLLPKESHADGISFECMGGKKDDSCTSLDVLLTTLASSDFSPCEHLPLTIAVNVAKGLEFLHSNGIVHRNQKPGNV